jgi:hypothetical protein
VSKPPSFSTDRSKKITEPYVLCLENGLGLPNGFRKHAACAAFRQIFSSNEKVPECRKKGLEGLLYKSAKTFDLLLKIQDKKSLS